MPASSTVGGHFSPQTAHAVSDGWNPDSESSFSMNDSATAPGSAGLRVERPEPGQQEQRESHVPLVLLRHLVDGLEHGLAGGEQREVLADRHVRRDDLGLGDRVERATAVIQHEVHVRERLQSCAEAAGRLADAFRDGPYLAGALGHHGHDLVGFAELDGPQDDALLFVRGHGRIVAPHVSRAP